MPGQPVSNRVHPGAREHYEHAAAYHARYASRVEDRDFYIRLSRGRGAVLEHGAGTGRLTVPLARRGVPVVAVDLAESMIAELRRQLARESPAVRRLVSSHVGDMRTFRSKKRFGLVVAGFHTVCHLYSHDDLCAFLACSFAHLEPGGLLAFDLPMPHVDMDGYDPIAQVRVTHMAGPDGPELLTQRLYQPCEILMHLHYAGFVRTRVTADFTSRRIDRDTDILVVRGYRPN